MSLEKAASCMQAPKVLPL